MMEIQIAYRIFTDLWRLFKKFNGKKLVNQDWEELIVCGEKIRKEYKDYGPGADRLVRDLFAAIQAYYAGQE